MPEAVEAAAPVVSQAQVFDLTAEAREGAKKAIERLNKIIEHGSAPDAIKATALLFTWGFVTPANAKASAAADAYRPPAPAQDAPVAPAAPISKREQRQANAEQSTKEGVYAVPNPPRLAVDNTR